MNAFKKIFINEKSVLLVILLNTVIIFLTESGIVHPVISLLDVICTLFFFVEMIYKNIRHGLKKYWTSGLDVMDGILVLVSLPTVITYITGIELIDLSFLLILRVLRIFRLFRLKNVFPDFDVIVRNFIMALKKSWAFLLIIFIFVLVFALIDCNLFREAAPQYFSTPMDAIYTTFRIFSVEGWYEIPDAIAEGMNNPIWVHITRGFFSLQLLLGGIIGMSLINSIFVDAMVSDNNDDLQEDITKVSADLDEVKQTLQKIQESLERNKE